VEWRFGQIVSLLRVSRGPRVGSNEGSKRCWTDAVVSQLPDCCCGTRRIVFDNLEFISEMRMEWENSVPTTHDSVRPILADFVYILAIKQILKRLQYPGIRYLDTGKELDKEATPEFKYQIFFASSAARLPHTFNSSARRRYVQ
jgi:hypothetical protein